MRRATRFIIIAFFAISCAKKSDQVSPKSAPPKTNSPAASPSVVTPYYPQLMLVAQNLWFLGGEYTEVLVGHDDSHVPKADKYLLIHHWTNSPKTDTTDALLWWSNGVPYSDVLMFRPDTSKPLRKIPWFQDIKGDVYWNFY